MRIDEFVVGDVVKHKYRGRGPNLGTGKIVEVKEITLSVYKMETGSGFIFHNVLGRALRKVK